QSCCDTMTIVLFRNFNLLIKGADAISDVFYTFLRQFGIHGKRKYFLCELRGKRKISRCRTQVLVSRKVWQCRGVMDSRFHTLLFQVCLQFIPLPSTYHVQVKSVFAIGAYLWSDNFINS